MSSLPPHMTILNAADAEDAFDAAHGTATWTADDLAKCPDGFGCFPTLPRAFKALMADLDLDFVNFAFVDVGCGRGRALLMASELPFRQCIGLERRPDLVESARANILAYRSATQRCKELSCVAADVAEVELPDGDLFVYLNNPFGGGEGLRAFVANLRRQLEAEPRRIVVSYFRPIEVEVFETELGLRRWGLQGLPALPPAEAMPHFLAGRFSWARLSNFGDPVAGPK